MTELIEYQKQRIEAMSLRIIELEQFVLELCDKDCPDDYKRIVKKQLLNSK